MIETIDDIVEEIADRLGIYGACKLAPEDCPASCNCRPKFTSDLADRIRRAAFVEKRLTEDKST